MIAFLARMLVGIAARRWPESSGMRREWLAELDHLAGQGHHGRMLRFAAGLTFARPTDLPVIGWNWRTAGSLLLLITGPAIVVAVQSLMFIVQRPPVAPFSTGWALPTWFAASLALAVVAGWWFGKVSVVKGPLMLAVLLTASICGLLIALVGPYARIVDYLFALDVWAPALMVLLLFVSWASQRGRGLLAVIVALVLWLIVLDVATMVFLSRWPEVATGLVGAHAPLWFVYQLIGTSFGVFGTAEAESINAMTTQIPHMLIVFAAYAMTFAARAARVNDPGPHTSATARLGDHDTSTRRR